ncbi:hypothetical protein GCM10011504_23260 [Siccirubricoccus deserti]|uniref:Uncharacterized protein n=1 Tax=Siccirubricoccus deserti TaxID=2013562 RepID=A0A9X0QXK4_9PROT|nr:hypothetical protein [Siccirubricoccus deserti]MBC4015740.1 hypothetical protein [Siccirubricoccus deserti]GGC44192.1 hypothetical protein GCM10011504_23260 [Siccirubricoccus deserti]
MFELLGRQEALARSQKIIAAAVLGGMLVFSDWLVLAGAVYLFLGIEPRGRSIERINRALHVSATVPRAAPVARA